MLKDTHAPYRRSLSTIPIVRGKPCPPVLRTAGGRSPTIFAAKAKGFPKTGGTGDTAVSKNDSMLIAGLL